jgi:hypothetical protein
MTRIGQIKHRFLGFIRENRLNLYQHYKNKLPFKNHNSLIIKHLDDF